MFFPRVFCCLIKEIQEILNKKGKKLCGAVYFQISNGEEVLKFLRRKMMSLTKYLILVFIAQNVIAKAVHDDAVVFRDSDEHESEEILNGSEEIMSTKSEKKYIGGDLQLKKNVFQGDIKLTEAQKSEITTRTGVRFDYLKWPKDDKGSAIVPYKIDAAYGWHSSSKDRVTLRNKLSINNFRTTRRQTHPKRNGWN